MKGQRWCNVCRATYMRKWRADRGGHAALSPEQRRRANARRYANTYQKRGKLVPPATCQRCHVEPPKEKHHEDYDQPLEVVWLCRSCHIEITTGAHRKE